MVSSALLLIKVKWGRNYKFIFRFITGECDKTIKIYKEDETATPETHPIEDFKIEFAGQRFWIYKIYDWANIY